MQEIWIKFSGTYNVELEPDTDKYLLAKGEFEFKRKSEDTNSGKVIYSVAPIRLEIGQGESVFKGKLKSKNSVRLRGALYHEYLKIDPSGEWFDKWYDEQTDKMIINLEQIINLIK